MPVGPESIFTFISLCNTVDGKDIGSLEWAVEMPDEEGWCEWPRPAILCLRKFWQEENRAAVKVSELYVYAPPSSMLL